MAYKKEITLSYDQLSPATLQRFAELELNKYLEILNLQLVKYEGAREKAIAHLINVICAQVNPGFRDELREAFSSHRFKKPTKDEIVQYFRYKNLGIAKVAKYAAVAPNTVVTYKEQYPDFVPVFKHWSTNAGQNVLERWDNIKSTINLFNDNVVHNEPLIRKVYTPEALPPEITESTMKVEKKKQDRNDPTIDRSKWIWVHDEWMERFDEYGNEHDYGIY